MFHEKKVQVATQTTAEVLFLQKIITREVFYAYIPLNHTEYFKNVYSRVRIQ